MTLDLNKLERVRRRGSNIIARCPACAEAGGDRKAEHLFINGQDKFGCVLFPGDEGQAHRKRIFELAGVMDKQTHRFEVRKPGIHKTGQKIVMKDILGHLGHFKSAHARKDLNTLQVDADLPKKRKETVPPVPEVPPARQLNVSFTPEEERLLAGLDAESLDKIRLVKYYFGGRVTAFKKAGQGAGLNQTGHA